MRLEKLTVAGFRGFNTPRTIDFHDRLTLVSAPNSHGKTSITEALEFLLYGQTSKVALADSKDEYKGSYTNKHYAGADAPFVEATFIDSAGTRVTLRAEIHGDEIRRFVDTTPVVAWPFASAMESAARPFVVQHALKDLLLAKPTDRFQGFARLLGLHDVEAAHQALLNLCTKPETQIPPKSRKLIDDLAVFEARLKGITTTASIAKSLGKGSEALDDTFTKVHDRGNTLLGKRVPPDNLSSELTALRSAAAQRIFAGSVAIKPLTTIEQQQASHAREKLARPLSEAFLNDYTRLAAGDASDRLRKELRLLALGIELTADVPGTCPFCEQPITGDQRARAEHRHSHLQESLGPTPDLSATRAQIAAILNEVRTSLTTHSALLAARSSDLIAANTKESSGRILALIGKGNSHALTLIAAAGATLAPHNKALRAAEQKAAAALEVCRDAVRAKTEDVAQAEALVKALAEYIAAADTYQLGANDAADTLEEPSRLLQQAVDAQAGTAELSLIIEVLAAHDSIRRAIKSREVLDGLKELKKHVNQAVGQIMEDAFSTELTGAVMNWYTRIRTSGDPDVHFSGFAMDRTQSGDFKSRRVKVSAQSYGVELASAVSSLSESKLNALGLCMSIATAIRAPGPWQFLVLDDPIQSWDDDHEIQFIEIVRALVEDEGRQIVLMSHREGWVDQVAALTRSLNGSRLQITGYTKDGPAIQPSDWANVDQRLKEALAIANDPAATKVRMQQAEEEIRIAACQIAAEVSRVKLKRPAGAHSMNSDKARNILTEAGCPSALLDRVIATFETTDDAHHAPKNYTANAERIRKYHGWLMELKNWLKPRA